MSGFKTIINTITQQTAKSILAGLMVVSLTAGNLMVAPQAQAVNLKLKDITHVKGVRNNQLVGYGLVVGLAKTGDKSRSTQNASYNLIQNFGGRLNNENDIRSTNTAAVIVTAIVPPFAKPGDPLDVVVSSMADASSLEGGVLVNTQLVAPNGEVVALAQGPLSTGGSSVEAGGSSKRTSITTSARIPNGAIMEREIYTEIGDDSGLEIVLDRTDFKMASDIAREISQNVAPARAVDGSTVRVLFPNEYIDDKVSFLAKIQDLNINVKNEISKVVVNERTGTIVIGNSVRLLPAAVAHGGITVSVKTTNEVSQPDAFSQGGQTIGVTNSEVDITKTNGSLVELAGNATLQDLVGALNSLGVTPTDLISVLQALKAAGSLEATLEII